MYGHVTLPHSIILRRSKIGAGGDKIQVNCFISPYFVSETNCNVANPLPPQRLNDVFVLKMYFGDPLNALRPFQLVYMFLVRTFSSGRAGGRILSNIATTANNQLFIALHTRVNRYSEVLTRKLQNGVPRTVTGTGNAS